MLRNDRRITAGDPFACGVHLFLKDAKHLPTGTPAPGERAVADFATT